MLTQLLLLLALQNVPTVEQSMTIDSFLISVDSAYRAESWEPVDQYYFLDVAFWRVDSSTAVSKDSVFNPQNLTLAIDRDLTVYRIQGFDTCEFNAIAAKYVRHITQDDAEGYGRFFITLQLGLPFEFYYFVTDIDDFIELNRRIMANRLTYCESLYEPLKTWAGVENNIRKTLTPYDLHWSTRDKQSGVIERDFYVWLTLSGDIVRYRLAISPAGECHIKQKETIASHIGYWTNCCR